MRLASILILLVLAGCNNRDYEYVVAQNTELRTELDTAQKKLDQLEQTNAELARRMRSISGITEEKRIEALNSPQEIEIYRLTGIYTRGKEKTNQLIVYVIPRDAGGDPVKAPGALTAQLWNLAAGRDESLIDQWDVSPQQLQDSWGLSLLSGYYRLAFELPADLPDDGDFYVRVTFTDYLTGKSLKAGRAVQRR